MRNNHLHEYKMIRALLKHIYIYGFYSMEEFIANGELAIKKGTYNKTIRQIKNLYFTDLDENEVDNGTITVNKKGKVRRYRFRRDYFTSQGEQLSAVYGMHSISKSEIVRIITSISCSAEEEGASTREIANTFSSLFTKKGDEDIDSSLKRTLKVLRDNGYLKNDKKRYWMVITSLTNEELMALYDLVSYFAGAGYPRVLAVFIKNTIRRALTFRGIDNLPNLFLFRDSPCGNVLDEDLIIQILSCCKMKKKIRIIVRKHNQEQEHLVSPVFLMPDTKLGRWYLIAIEDGLVGFTRVADIVEVKPTDTRFDYNQAQVLVAEKTQNSYLCADRENQSPIYIEAKLNFNHEGILQQFEREILLGKIEKRTDGDYYCVNVNNLSEIRPLVRSYFRYLELPKESILHQEIKEEYRRMRGLYETI